MNDKNFKRHMAYEALVILGLLALLTYITRLWPILLLIILGSFIATLRRLFLSCKKVEPVKPTLALPPPSAPSTETDMQSIAYAIIQRRITQILRDRFPEVRWIWENPKAKEDIMIGNPVYVLLNRAGGYRRGRVVIQNLTVMDVVFEEEKHDLQNGIEDVAFAIHFLLDHLIDGKHFCKLMLPHGVQGESQYTWELIQNTVLNIAVF